jgi:uncharacterized membrane protein
MKSLKLILLIISSESVFASSLSFDCGGFEPSFSLKIRGNEISYASPDKELPKIQINKISTEHGTTVMSAKASSGEQVTLTLIENKNCVSDGEGSKKSSHQIQAKIGKSILTGCCDKTLSK